MEQAPQQAQEPVAHDGDAAQQQQESDVVGYLPRYAIPNIASLLPTYTNSEQEFIHRTFHTGNYDYLKHLPHDIKYRQARRRLHGVRPYHRGAGSVQPD